MDEANIIERHFTILNPDQSKDGPVSITPDQLKELSEFSNLDKKEMGKIILNEIPNFKVMLGSQIRKLTNEEILNRDYYRGRFADKRTDGSYRYNWELK